MGGGRERAAFRIRMVSGFNQVSESGSESGSSKTKMTKKIEKSSKCHVLKCWMFSFEGFSCSLDVLYGGLGISKSQFFIRIRIQGVDDQKIN
jgi:hypothetical protein